MLQQMRSISKSWVSSLFLFALAASFGVWGIADIFRGNTDTSVATVGDVKIPADLLQRDFTNAKTRATQENNAQLSAAETHSLGNQAFQRLLDGAAVDEVSSDMGLVASDPQVRASVQSIGAFRGPLGTFDRNTFLEVLQRMSYTEDGFIDETRHDITREQLIFAAANGMQIPEGFASAMFMYLNEHREVQYITLPPDAAGAIPNPDDATLLAYMKNHASQFSTPEYRDVTYATIAPDDVTAGLQVSDDQLRQQYELAKDKYVIPEKRDIEQITFPDQASANAALAQIDGGKSFADIAAARGLKPIELTDQTEANLGDRGAAAFAVPQNGTSKPVKFIVGWVIMHVTKVTPGSAKTFDDVKADLKKDALLLLANNKISDLMNAFSDARAGGDTLEEAAKKSNMHVVHIAAVDRNGMAPDGSKTQAPTEPEFLGQAFKAETGEDEDPFPASDGRQFVIRVNGVTPPKLKPLDSVRAQVTAEWLAQERMRRLSEKAKTLAAQATAAHSLTAAAAALHTTVQSAGPLSRGTPSTQLNGDLVQSIFAVPAATAVAGKTLTGDGYVVALVTGVVHPALPYGDPRLQKFEDELSKSLADDTAGTLGQAARTKVGVKINQQQVDQVIGNGS